MSTESICESLSQTFGKVPAFISENLKYCTYDDERDHFKCNVCDKIIQLNYKNENKTTENFKKHLLSQTHKSNTVSETDIWNWLNATFQNLVPKLIQQNAHILGASGDDYRCEICNKTLEISTSPSISEASIAQHILTDHHENKLKTFKDNLRILQNIFGYYSYEIYHNKQYLTFTRRGNYLCIICDEVLIVDHDDLKNTKQRFKEHFETEDHVSNSQQARATSKIPLLDQIYDLNPIPLNVLKNIDYLSTNQAAGVSALYCSLCNESFQFSQTDLKMSEQSLKNHIFSENHEEGLRNRRDSDDDVYSKLHHLLDAFPEDVVDKLVYVSTYEDDFICKICNVYIDEGTGPEALQENIESHMRSSSHEEEFSREMERCTELINDLLKVFGTIPEFIENDLPHIEHKAGIDFTCTLCDKTLRSYNYGNCEENTSITKENFANHLRSKGHLESSKGLDDLKDHIEAIFSPALIPYHVSNNSDNLGYNYDEQHFFCYLCQVEIKIHRGPKANELTIMNLNKHLLSLDHVYKLKHKAYKKYITKSKLHSIFGGISDLIMNNIQHLEQCGDYYRCKLCDAKILQGSHSGITRKKFHSHLDGGNHRSMVELLEKNHEKAQRELLDRFWIIPECLLKNLDFVSVRKKDIIEGDSDDSDSDQDGCDEKNDEIYCKPCQITLPLSGCLDNQILQYHFESKAHEENVGIY